MNLNLTPEQIAEIKRYIAENYPNAKLFGFEAAKLHFRPRNEGIEFYQIIEFDNWRELCFERPKEEEKPVNEACLFKPVLARDLDYDEWARVIFLGFKKDNCFMGTLDAENKEANYFSGCPYLQWKRIPGYDYGD